MIRVDDWMFKDHVSDVKAALIANCTISEVRQSLARGDFGSVIMETPYRTIMILERVVCEWAKSRKNVGRNN